MIRKRLNELARALPACAVLLAAFGCEPETAPQPQDQPALPQEFLQVSWEPQEVPVAHIVRRDYRLREGDFLEIIYHVKHAIAEAYRMKIEDVVVVRFPFNPSLNQTEQVQSDGKLYLDLIGPVRAIGKTIDELQRELYSAYSKYLKEPTLTVSFKESNVKITELKKPREARAAWCPSRRTGRSPCRSSLT